MTLSQFCAFLGSFISAIQQKKNLNGCNALSTATLKKNMVHLNTGTQITMVYQDILCSEGTKQTNKKKKTTSRTFPSITEMKTVVSKIIAHCDCTKSGTNTVAVEQFKWLLRQTV